MLSLTFYMTISLSKFKASGVIAALLVLSSCSKTPEACFSVDKGSLNTKVNEEIQFSTACTTDGDSYAWEYGDGSGDTGASAKHKYPQPGSYVVKLTAKNSSKSSSASKTVTVTQ